MKTKLIILSIILLSFLIIGNNVSASITNGTIDSNYHYAYGENIGFIDFKNITISDTSLSGFIYGENIGWIDLSTITNTTEGRLGGYAWGENVGWIDFSKTTIGTDGVFTGGAYGENIGWITFGTTTNKVLTDWRPLSVRPVPHSSGSTLAFRNNYLAQQNLNTPATTVPPTLPLPTINRTLKYKMTGNDVKKLQVYLNIHGYPVATTGAGSLGKETNLFGKLTKQAVIKFQIANNLKSDGILGPLTKALLK